MSPKFHITIDYDENIDGIINKIRYSTFKEKFKCSVKLVDITSEEPKDWKTIE